MQQVSRLITVEDINFQINGIRLIILLFLFSFWSSKDEVLDATMLQEEINATSFRFFQRYVRLIDTFTRNEISYGADRVAKWMALCARFHPGARDVSLRLVRRLVSRLENARTSVHGVIPRIVTGKLVAFHNTGFNGPFWAPPQRLSSKKELIFTPATRRRSENLNDAHEWLAFAGKFAR